MAMHLTLSSDDSFTTQDVAAGCHIQFGSPSGLSIDTDEENRPVIVSPHPTQYGTVSNQALDLDPARAARHKRNYRRRTRHKYAKARNEAHILAPIVIEMSEDSPSPPASPPLSDTSVWPVMIKKRKRTRKLKKPKVPLVIESEETPVQCPRIVIGLEDSSSPDICKRPPVEAYSPTVPLDLRGVWPKSLPLSSSRRIEDVVPPKNASPITTTPTVAWEDFISSPPNSRACPELAEKALRECFMRLTKRKRKEEGSLAKMANDFSPQEDDLSGNDFCHPMAFKHHDRIQHRHLDQRISQIPINNKGKRPIQVQAGRPRGQRPIQVDGSAPKPLSSTLSLKERMNKTYSFKREGVRKMFQYFLKNPYFKLPDLKYPERPDDRKKPNFCLYHRLLGHVIEDCFTFKDWLEMNYKQGTVVIPEEYQVSGSDSINLTP